MSIVSIINNKYLSLSLSPPIRQSKCDFIGTEDDGENVQASFPVGDMYKSEMLQPVQACVCPHVCITSPEKSKFIFAPLA